MNKPSPKNQRSPSRAKKKEFGRSGFVAPPHIDPLHGGMIAGHTATFAFAQERALEKEKEKAMTE